MAKYRYEFIRIEAKPFSRKPKEDYKRIIDEKSREGWRLVQIFSPGTGISKLLQTKLSASLNWKT